MQQHINLPEFDDVVEAYVNIRKEFPDHGPYYNYLLPLSYADADNSGKNVSVGVNEFQAIAQIGSYKLFGAFNAIYNYFQANDGNPVIYAASAGNHAQGVALSASKMGKQARIYMPEGTPINKIIGTLRHGVEDVSGLEALADNQATSEQVKLYLEENDGKFKNVKVVIAGKNFDETSQIVQQVCGESQGLFIPPYNHKDVIAGAGTWAFQLLDNLLEFNFNSSELTKQSDFKAVKDLMVSNPDDWKEIIKTRIAELYGEGGKDLSIALPIGGGGIAAGVSIVLRELVPQCELIAVSLEKTPSVVKSMETGSPVETDVPPLEYDDGSMIPGGTKVRKIGDLTFQIINQNFDKAVEVDHDAFMAFTANNLFHRESMSEPQAGATAVAVLKEGTRPVRISFKSGENLSEKEISYLKGKFAFYSLPNAMCNVLSSDNCILSSANRSQVLQ